MREKLMAVVLALFGIVAAPGAAAITCLQYYGQTHTEDFNSLASVGTSSTLPAGWGFEAFIPGSTYAANDGTNGASGTYSFGNSSDRALGEISDSVYFSYVGFCAVNATSYAVKYVEIGYTGEKWRSGSATTDHLLFQYSLDATSILFSGTWTSIPALDFAMTSQAAGATDGNLSANRQVFTPVGIALPGGWLPGQTLFLRWAPENAGNLDHGMAIDDFILQTQQCRLDIDDDGSVDALTDGLLLIRAMFGLTGAAVTNNVVGANAKRANWSTIRGFLNGSCAVNFGP